jgi:hypothetical protein
MPQGRGASWLSGRGGIQTIGERHERLWSTLLGHLYFLYSHVPFDHTVDVC